MVIQDEASMRNGFKDERFEALTRQQIADALNINVFTLDEMHKKNLGPPRFKASPRRWAYRLDDFRKWQDQQRAKETA
jgi:hypothetical protein